MKAELQRLHAMVMDDSLPGSRMFEGIDLGEILDSRDDAPFDTEWVRANGEVEEAAGGLDDDQAKLIEAIRERAYKRAFKMTEDPDAAACVSDDLGLVATAMAIGYDGDWLKALWLSYRSGVFPCGVLQPSQGRWEELI